MNEGNWIDVFAAEDLEEELPEEVQAGVHYLALFRIGERVYATSGLCSHAEAKLCDGFVDGETVECPLHQARFHIPTGRVLSAPADQDIAVYPTEIRDGRVYVFLPPASSA